VICSGHETNIFAPENEGSSTVFRYESIAGTEARVRMADVV
jgi:hypothetical protein